LNHRPWRATCGMRVLRELFLNPAPLGCHQGNFHLFHWLSLFVCVSAQVMCGALRC